MPKPNPSLTRLVNSIILDEESDLDINNEPKSHFAMYLEAMEEMGVKTTTIDKFISTVRCCVILLEFILIMRKFSYNTVYKLLDYNYM